MQFHHVQGNEVKLVHKPPVRTKVSMQKLIFTGVSHISQYYLFLISETNVLR